MTSVYFVVNNLSLQDIKASFKSSEVRVKRPSDEQILKIKNARTDGCQVLLILSGKGYCGFHAIAQMLSFIEDDRWLTITIKLLLNYSLEVKTQCLPYKLINGLTTVDGVPVQNAENFSELTKENGMELWNSMDKHLKELLSKQAQKRTPSFWDSSLVTKLHRDLQWKDLELTVTNNLGKVICMAPYGSRRYNLSVSDSDEDMLVVYQASTHKLLGFEPPFTTIKNHDWEAVEYNIIELQRFCEFLRDSDPRHVELLFCDEMCIRAKSCELEQLQQRRNDFLTKELIRKYLQNACGPKGLRHVDRLVSRATPDELKSSVLLNKQYKMYYIIVRLLQNAREIAEKGTLNVWRHTDCKQHTILMKIRVGDYNVDELKELVKTLEEETRSALDSCSLPDKISLETANWLENWLIEIRTQDLT